MRTQLALVRRPTLSAIGALFLLLLALTACGGSAPLPTTAAARSAASAAPTAAGGSIAAASSAPSTAASSAPRAAPPSSAASSAVGPGTTQADPNTAPRRMLIKTGTLGLLVRDVDAAFGRISAIAQQYGGEVSQYTNSKNGDLRVANVTILVDSGQFEAAMTALREMGEIVERRTDKAESTDVGEEFADIQAQITNLETTERQLRAILEKATRTEDILAVQREITNVRGQIERLQGRANYLDRRAAMSTIAIGLEMVPPVGVVEPPAPVPAWRFTSVVAEAWNASLRVVQLLVSVVVSVVIFCWWLLPPLAIAALVLRLRRQRATGGPTRGSAPPAATGD